MKYAIRKAEARDIPRMTEIWVRVFGDPEAYVSLFYRRNFSRMRVWVRTADDEVIGMLHLLPGTVASGNTRLPCALGYAGAVLPEYRGKGLLREVFLTAFAACDAEGKALIIKPANRKLSEYYKSLGMADNAFWRRETVLPGDAPSAPMPTVAFEPLTAEAYEALRNKTFSAIPYLKWDTAHIAWSIEENAFCGGETVGFSCNGVPHFAMLIPENETLRVIETSLSPEECRAFAPVLLQRYHCTRLTAVFPGTDDEPITIARNCPILNVYPNLLMI